MIEDLHNLCITYLSDPKTSRPWVFVWIILTSYLALNISALNYCLTEYRLQWDP